MNKPQIIIGRLVSTSDCYAGRLPIKSGILPLLKHICAVAAGNTLGPSKVHWLASTGEVSLWLLP